MRASPWLLALAGYTLLAHGCDDAAAPPAPELPGYSFGEIRTLTLNGPAKVTSAAIEIEVEVHGAGGHMVSIQRRRLDSIPTSSPNEVTFTVGVASAAPSGTTTYRDTLPDQGVYAYAATTPELTSNTIVVTWLPDQAISPGTASTLTTGESEIPKVESFNSITCQQDAMGWLSGVTGCIQRDQYTAAGPDGIWGTADDTLSARDVYLEQNSAQRLVVDLLGPLATFSAGLSPGIDQRWDTPDDLVLGRTAVDDLSNPSTMAILYGFYRCLDHDPGYAAMVLNVKTNASGIITSATGSDHPGADGLWGTADDVLVLRGESSFPTTDQLELRAYSAAGSDGFWGTADDVTSAIRRVLFAGALTLEVESIDDPGADGVWSTADDTGQRTTFFYAGSAPVSSVTRRLPDLSVLEGRKFQTAVDDSVSVATYVTAGNDGIFPSADDSVFRMDRYAACP